jgi:predicted sugar kinase
VLGTHFAPAQEGRRFTSPAVGQLIDWIGAHACAGIGQSSWGPTGFAVVASIDEARSVLHAAQRAGVVDPALQIRVTPVRNRGAGVRALHVDDSAAVDRSTG